MLQTVGSNGYGTYFIYGSFNFTIGIIAYLFVPETKGVGGFKLTIRIIADCS